jgi:iron complex outermembrane receptor protein
LIAVLFTITPSPGQTDDVSTPSDRFRSDELELLKEEESVSIESREKQPIPPSSSEPYVMTEEDIRESGVPDLPALLRRMLGFDAPQVTESDITDRARGGSQRVANSFLVVVDGRPIHIDRSDPLMWKHVPVTLHDVHRLEMWKESVSAVSEFAGYDVVIKIITKKPEK